MLIHHHYSKIIHWIVGARMMLVFLQLKPEKRKTLASIISHIFSNRFAVILNCTNNRSVVSIEFNNIARLSIYWILLDDERYVIPLKNSSRKCFSEVPKKYFIRNMCFRWKTNVNFIYPHKHKKIHTEKKIKSTKKNRLHILLIIICKERKKCQCWMVTI